MAGLTGHSFETGVFAFVPIPDAATHAEIWFENTDVSGCHRYDSDYGKNYQLDVN